MKLQVFIKPIKRISFIQDSRNKLDIFGWSILQNECKGASCSLYMLKPQGTILSSMSSLSRGGHSIARNFFWMNAQVERGERLFVDNEEGLNAFVVVSMI